MLQPPRLLWSVVLPIKNWAQIKICHLWKMIIKILHFYILLTMKRDSVLINISTRLSYTDYTQQVFNKYFWYILKYVSQSKNFIPPKTGRLQLINPVFWYRYCAQVDTTVLLLKKQKTQHNNPASRWLVLPDRLQSAENTCRHLLPTSGSNVMYSFPLDHNQNTPPNQTQDCTS